LTDGNQWEFYDVFVRKPLDERRLLDVSISNDAAHECALKLLLLWHPNLASGQPVQPSAPVLGHSAERQPPPAAAEPSPSKPVPTPMVEGWVSLTELGTAAGAPAPASIRFSDGQEVSSTSWKSLLVETGKWLDGKGLLGKAPASIPSSPKRYLLHTVPKHQTGNEFNSPVHLTQSGAYLETHASAEYIVARTIQLLKAFGQDPARVYVRPRA